MKVWLGSGDACLLRSYASFRARCPITSDSVARRAFRRLGALRECVRLTASDGGEQLYEVPEEVYRLLYALGACRPRLRLGPQSCKLLDPTDMVTELALKIPILAGHGVQTWFFSPGRQARMAYAKWKFSMQQLDRAARILKQTPKRVKGKAAEGFFQENQDNFRVKAETAVKLLSDLTVAITAQLENTDSGADAIKEVQETAIDLETWIDDVGREKNRAFRLDQSVAPGTSSLPRRAAASVDTGRFGRNSLYGHRGASSVRLIRRLSAPPAARPVQRVAQSVAHVNVIRLNRTPAAPRITKSHALDAEWDAAKAKVKTLLEENGPMLSRAQDAVMRHETLVNKLEEQKAVADESLTEQNNALEAAKQTLATTPSTDPTSANLLQEVDDGVAAVKREHDLIAAIVAHGNTEKEQLAEAKTQLQYLLRKKEDLLSAEQSLAWKVGTEAGTTPGAHAIFSNIGLVGQGRTKLKAMETTYTQALEAAQTHKNEALKNEASLQKEQANLALLVEKVRTEEANIRASRLAVANAPPADRGGPLSTLQPKEAAFAQSESEVREKEKGIAILNAKIELDEGKHRVLMKKVEDFGLEIQYLATIQQRLNLQRLSPGRD